MSQYPKPKLFKPTEKEIKAAARRLVIEQAKENRDNIISNIDSKILELLCKDFTQIEIAELIKISISTIEKRINLLKDGYRVKTLSGLIYKFILEKEKK